MSSKKSMAGIMKRSAMTILSWKVWELSAIIGPILTFSSMTTRAELQHRPGQRLALNAVLRRLFRTNTISMVSVYLVTKLSNTQENIWPRISSQLISDHNWLWQCRRGSPPLFCIMNENKKNDFIGCQWIMLKCWVLNQCSIFCLFQHYCCRRKQSIPRKSEAIHFFFYNLGIK